MAGDGSGVLGQQSLTDANSGLNHDAYQGHQMTGRIRTMTFGKIEKIKGGGGAVEKSGTVDFTPLVNQVDGEGKPTEHGKVHGQQYFRLQGGKNAVIIDPEVGDIVCCISSDRDTSAVIEKRGKANPGSGRRFDIADSVCLPGVINEKPERYIRFSTSDDLIEMVTKGGAKVTLKNNTVTVECDKLVVKGDVEAENDVFAHRVNGSGGVSLKNHVHQNGGGVGLSGPPNT